MKEKISKKVLKFGTCMAKKEKKDKEKEKR